MESQPQTTYAESTPKAVRFPDPIDLSPVGPDQRYVELLPNVRNVPDTMIHRRIEPTWRKKPITVKKYVDDNNTTAKLYIKDAPTYNIDGQTIKNVRASEAEDMFKHICRRAEASGLRVNNNKTALLTISAATSYTAKTHIYDEHNSRIDSTSTLKTVGFIFNQRADITDQLNALKMSFRTKTWTLRHLKQSGFTEDELKRFYTTNIRPSLEYSSVVYHSMMTQEQEHDLEMQQSRALKNIYGHTYSYERLIQISGLQTLKQRREDACFKFASKMATNPRFAAWFPKRTTRTRSGQDDEYVEFRARTNRRMRSPLFYYRRILNQNRRHYD